MKIRIEGSRAECDELLGFLAELSLRLAVGTPHSRERRGGVVHVYADAMVRPVAGVDKAPDELLDLIDAAEKRVDGETADAHVRRLQLQIALWRQASMVAPHVLWQRACHDRMADLGMQARDVRRHAEGGAR